MEIGGRDYSMERGGETRYFVLVEDAGQIPLIKGEQIHAFALLDEKNTVHYYL